MGQQKNPKESSSAHTVRTPTGDDRTDADHLESKPKDRDQPEAGQQRPGHATGKQPSGARSQR